MAVLDTGESKASLVAIRSAPDAHKGIAGQCMHTKGARVSAPAPGRRGRERARPSRRQADEDERGHAHHGARPTRTREGAPITAPTILETECNQRSSEVVRGHQRSSEVVRGHKRSSEDIPSPTILETKCHPVHAQHSVLDDCRLCSTACRQSRSPVAMAAV